MGFADDLKADLRNRARRAFERLADEVERDVRDRIGVPVEYRTGPRGGRIVIRSKPGEPPRRETGQYRDSLTHEVTEEGGLLVATIWPRMQDRAGWLENGTNHILPRPHWTPAYRYWLDEAPALIAKEMFG